MSRARYLPRPLARFGARFLQRSVQRPFIPIRAQRAWFALACRAVRRPRGVEATVEELGGVPATRMEEDGSDRGCAVLYLHGGAYIVGSARTHGALAARIAQAAGAAVHVLDYRLAPEHPYPAAIDDAVSAYGDLRSSGLAPDRIAIAGDSAGAALAIATALRLRDAGERQPAGLVLVNAWLDVTCSGASAKENARRDVGLRRSWAVAGGDAYRAGRDPSLPEISPLAADLRGLPPIHLQVGTDDILLSDSDTFTAKALEAGVDVSYRRFEGMWHDFQVAAGQLREADEALEDIGRALSSQLNARAE